jgi:hypothetical protein
MLLFLVWRDKVHDSDFERRVKHPTIRIDCGVPNRPALFDKSDEIVWRLFLPKSMDLQFTVPKIRHLKVWNNSINPMTLRRQLFEVFGSNANA